MYFTFVKIRLNSKGKLEGSIENKSCSATPEDPKNVFEPYPNPKNNPLGPKEDNTFQKTNLKVA